MTERGWLSTHGFPWQRITARMGLALCHRLELPVDARELIADCERVVATHALKPHFNNHHDGRWSAIAFVAAGGDPLEDRKRAGPYLKTAVLRDAPAVEALLDGLPGEKNRVRLMRLAPGGRVFWHVDEQLSLDRRFVRLHVPIRTNPDAHSQISHVDCRWQPGEFWYADFSFPHRVRNAGRTDRVHLVIDLVVEDALRRLFPESFHAEATRRAQARARIAKWMRAWELPFQVGRMRRKLVGADTPAR